MAFVLNKKTLCLLRSMTVALVLPWTLGCQIPYMTQSAYNHLKIMSGKQKIERLLKKDSLNPELKHKLTLAMKIRPYINSLGLNVTDNYTTYVELKSPYISYLMTVTPAYSLKTKEWRFPLIGSFPYLGFHNKEKALAKAKRFQQRNYDTYVRGVSAYSTLGWFKDPLLSTMMRYSDAQLIETIIHESVHATVFIKNNVSLNENLAVFIARQATLEFYQQHHPELYEKLAQSYKDEEVFLKFMNTSIRGLKEFYKDSKNHTPELKAQALEKIKTTFIEEIQPQLKVLKYESFNKSNSERKLNNAFFASQGVYYANLDKIKDKYSEYNNIKKFIAFLKDKEKSEQLSEVFNQ